VVRCYDSAGHRVPNPDRSRERVEVHRARTRPPDVLIRPLADPLAVVRTRMLSEDGKHDFQSDDARAVTGPANAFVAEVEDTPAVLREAQ
jgi:hypothetical protein